MINRRHLPLILTALLLHGAPLFAQTAAVPEPEPSEVPVNSPAAGEATGKAPVANDTRAKKPANESPYDYRSSEEISEDLSVSFPVDI
jgi:hypothetical protein